VERDLQEQVTELLAQVGVGARLDRVDHLRGLLDEVVQQRRVRLFGIPRTACTQRVHHRHEPPQLVVAFHIHARPGYLPGAACESEPDPTLVPQVP